MDFILKFELKVKCKIIRAPIQNLIKLRNSNFNLKTYCKLLKEEVSV